MIPYKENIKQEFKYYVYSIQQRSKKSNWKRKRRISHK